MTDLTPLEKRMREKYTASECFIGSDHGMIKLVVRNETYFYDIVHQDLLANGRDHLARALAKIVEAETVDLRSRLDAAMDVLRKLVGIANDDSLGLAEFSKAIDILAADSEDLLSGQTPKEPKL